LQIVLNSIILGYYLHQGWVSVVYGGPRWRFYCYRGPHARFTCIASNRFENLKKGLHELPQNEGNNSHFRLSKNAVSNAACGKKNLIVLI